METRLERIRSARWTRMGLLLPLFAAASAGAQLAPGYHAGKLTVPRVDTPEQVGRFQDGVLQLTPQGTFSITGLQELGLGPVYPLLGIEKVEVVVSAGLPSSVFLRVSGVDPTCDYAGGLRLHQRRNGERFEVAISAPHHAVLGAAAACPANIRPYRITVPLEVYGLAAGSYSFTVNGGFVGQFTLAQANRFADDCDVLKYGNCESPVAR